MRFQNAATKEADGQATACGPDVFAQTLDRHGLELRRGQTHTLQINVGLQCNQSCRHCHLDAGPSRSEVMSRETMAAVAAYAGRCRFQVIDVTGGAPEMNPLLPHFLETLAPLASRLMLRSNLTALSEFGGSGLIRLCRDLGVTIVASFPATNSSQTASMRGKGVWETSIDMLRRLNEAGYGREGTGLDLHLVANPAGAFLPVAQSQAEKKFKADLARKWGIGFNKLYTFANVPLGRFRRWLEESGNSEGYMSRLKESFNPCTVDGLMCRSLVSVSWDGYLLDCDFNGAAGLYLGNIRNHVSEMTGPPPAGAPIMVGEHCFACTAGAGFT